MEKGKLRRIESFHRGGSSNTKRIAGGSISVLVCGEANDLRLLSTTYVDDGVDDSPLAMLAFRGT